MLRWYRDILRNDLASFIGKSLSAVDPGAKYLPNWHVDLIAEYLEAAGRSEITRLIINMPPRSLKSVCVSVAWPAWLMGHNPESRIITASYAASLSIKHSIDSRLILGMPWYRSLFPELQLSKEQNEKHKYMTTARGYRLATSVGGSVTGEGGNFLIVDDPLKPQQALNSTYREAANSWFDHTFSTRLDDKKKGVIVVVMQRLHQQDLTGHLLDKGGWEHLCIPAVAKERTIYRYGDFVRVREAGEVLHEGREDHAMMERMKIELGSHMFAAQYQQEPLPAEGEVIRPWWLQRYKNAPAEFDCIVQSWDTSIKAGKQHDPSVCLTFGEWQQKSYLLDVQLLRVEYPELKKMFYRMCERFKPHAILIEDKASGQQLLQDARRESPLPVIAMRSKYDKLTRFAAVAALIEAGTLWLPEHAPWLAEFEEELLTFPNARHDDQVDALSQYLDWKRGAMWGQLRIRSL